MDDGTPDRSGFIFHTNSFTHKEVRLLLITLKNKFDLNCSIMTRKDRVNKQYLLYIKAES
jgi:LAGLIDADG DNA endonuclease family